MNLLRIARTVDLIQAAVVTGLALALLFATVPSQAAVKTGFPRIGQMLIGSPQPYRDASAQAQMARFDMVIIDVSPASAGPEMRAALRAIKARNPNVILLDYAVVNETSLAGPGQQYLRDKLNSQKWWQYSGSAPMKSVWPGAGMTNYSASAPVDGNGDRWNTWYAKEQNRRVWSKVPELDGTYEDNFFWSARAGGMGTSAHRAGMLKHIDTIKQVFPGKYYTANIGDWRNTGSVPEYEGQLQGGTLEGYLCRFERSFEDTRKEYYRRMREVSAPKLVMLNAEKCTSSGFDRYKSFRYGLGITLMNDGYYDFNENYSKFPTQWFDEYDLAGARTTSWMGKALDPPPTAPWRNGVWRRRFEGGMALVNPKGNGAQTVDIEPGYRRIKGRQVPGVNDGAEARRVTLPDRDGLVLVAYGRLDVTEPPPVPQLICPVGCVPAP